MRLGENLGRLFLMGRDPKAPDGVMILTSPRRERDAANSITQPGQLGCEFCEENNCIQRGENTATNIPGVTPRGMPAAVCSSSSRLQPRVWRQPSQSIARSSMRMLGVMRCAITSRPPTPSNRITPGATRALTGCTCERLARQLLRIATGAQISRPAFLVAIQVLEGFRMRSNDAQ